MALIIFCLLSWFIPVEAEEIVWKARLPEDFAVEVRISEQKISIEDSLLITLLLHFPAVYQPDLSTIRYNLLKNNRFMPTPFLYTKEQVEPMRTENGQSSQKITFFLDPQIPGTHSLTFYEFPFIQIDNPQKKISIPSEIFTLTFTPAHNQQPFTIVTAPLMPVDTAFPVDLQVELRQQQMTTSPQALQATLENKSFPLKYLAGIIGAAGIAFLFRRKLILDLR